MPWRSASTSARLASEPPRDDAFSSGAGSVGPANRWVPVLIGIAVVCAIAAWEVAPRFELDSPSLVDDWWAIDRSPEGMSAALRLDNVEEQRYRPGWILWGFVQWHTFDAPNGLVGPNVWNVARILVLVAGLSLLTTLALPPPRRARDSIVVAGLAVLPALLVVAVEAFAVDLARFGPQEPLLVGAMALGGSLLVLAVQALLTDAARVSRAGTAFLTVAGSAFWAFGVYQKELSVCALPLVAAAVVAGRARLGSWRRLGLGRRLALVAVGVVVLLPLVHVTVESLLIARRGDLIYDAQVEGGRGAVNGFVDLAERYREALGLFAVVVVASALVAFVAVVIVARTIDTLALGALLSGLLALFAEGQAGVVVSRYYIPTLALFAIGLSLALARFRRSVQVVALVTLTALAVPYVSAAHDEVDTWVGGEREWSEFVRSVTEADASGCIVAVAGFELETASAIPVLVALQRQGERGGCPEGEAYLVVGPGETGAALLRTCAPGALETLRDWPSGSVYRCARAASEPVEDPELGSVAARDLIDRRRLEVPAG